MKTRFAPSPTGLIHLGNARTALFSALFAQGQSGQFLLRIEDTDKARSTEEFVTALVRDLQWLGIAWQEGEGLVGPHAPYRQSARSGIYEQYYEALVKAGRAYPCYCSEEDLDLERKLQKASGQPPRYSGKCKALSPEAYATKVAAGITPVLRFAVEKGSVVEFEDGVKGRQVFRADDIGDFIIRRNDGGSSFLFCNAIDDSLMGVTHVLRGEDHLTNTPRQLMILEALDLRQPHYAHMALINGIDGAPLSKRNGSRSIQELRDVGFLSRAVLNYMARLGHYYENNALMNYQELAEQFALKHLGSSAARFDQDQLLYWQRTVVHQLNDAEFWAWAGQDLQDLVSVEQEDLFVKTIRENVLFPSEAKRYAALLLSSEFTLTLHHDIVREAGAAFFDVAIDTLNAKGPDFAALSAALTERLGVKGKALFMPLRVALTGELHGPQMAAVLTLLGQEEAWRRLRQAQSILGIAS